MTAYRNPWHFGEWWLTGEFDGYQSLLALLDEELQARLSEREEGLREASESAESLAMQIDLEMVIADEGIEGEKFRSILFNSFFAASFALFEHKLSTICLQVQGASGTPFTVNDMRTSSRLYGPKSYLERLGIDFPAQGSDWQEITTYQKLRNSIMHHGGEIPEGSDLLEYAEKQGIASSWNGRELQMTRVFCEEAMTTLAGFLLKLHRLCRI